MAFTALKKELLRLDREKHHLEYLETCKEIGLIPKFLLSKSSFLTKNFPSDKFKFETKCLKSIIWTKYALIDRINKKIYGYRNDGLYSKLADDKTRGVFDHSMRVIEKYRLVQDSELQQRLIKKIQNLSSDLKSFEKSSKKFEFLNLSSHHFTEREVNLLNKGPKYIVNSKVHPINFIPQLEDVIKNAPPDKREELRCLVFLAYMKHQKATHKSTFHESNLVKSIKSIPNIAILQTDKSNKIAILDKSEYISKMESTIISMGCSIVNKDPLSSMIYKVNKIAKAFRAACWPEEIRKLAKLNPLGIVPHIFGVLKDHKAQLPLRPIVRRCSAPSFYIEKVLVAVLKEFLPPSNHVVSSSSQFVEKIQQLSLPDNFFMSSLDIISLYPSVNMECARDNIVKILDNDPNLSNEMKITIITAVNFLISNNFFIFNECIYQQMSGAPMGSPVSGLLAEFILRPLEENFLSSTAIKPLCWLRYIDDIFVIWTSSEIEFTNFFNSLNNQDPSMQFTKECEINNKLSFLDVLLTKEGNTISRSVYRKPCNTLCTIPKQAIAPNAHKQAAFRSYVKRAMVICTQNKIHEELNIIRKIAIDNGYSLSFVNDIILKVTRAQQHPPAEPLVKRIPLQYIPTFHEKLSRIVRNYGIQLVAHTNQKMKSILRTQIDSIPKFHSPGVYEIPLLHINNEITHYIGQTCRKLKFRIYEHKADLKHCQETSAIYRAISKDPSIHVMFEEARIIAPYTNYNRTVMRESLEIYVRRNKVCNEQDSCKIPSVWLTII